MNSLCQSRIGAEPLNIISRRLRESPLQLGGLSEPHERSVSTGNTGGTVVDIRQSSRRDFFSADFYFRDHAKGGFAASSAKPSQEHKERNAFGI